MSSEKEKLLQKKLPDIMSTNLSSISMDIINDLGEALSLDPDERRIELIESACNYKLSEVLETCSNIKCSEQDRNKLQVCHYYTVFVKKTSKSALLFQYFNLFLVFTYSVYYYSLFLRFYKWLFHIRRDY